MGRRLDTMLRSARKKQGVVMATPSSIKSGMLKVIEALEKWRGHNDTSAPGPSKPKPSRPLAGARS